MTNLPSFTAAQLSFLESVLCPSPSLLAMEEGIGGCDDSDQGEGDKPPATLGTNKDDTLLGGEGKDNLVGLNWNDTLRAFQGKDWLYGQGNDVINGGSGDDVLFGGNSPDTYTGGLGRDVFVLALPGGEGGHGGGGEIASTPGPLAHEEEEGDVVTDFEQGVDHLALAGALTFDQLRFAGNRIYVVMDETAGASTPLASPTTPGNENEGLGRLLATLNGFNTTQLSEADFITWADFSLG